MYNLIAVQNEMRDGSGRNTRYYDNGDGTTMEVITDGSPSTEGSTRTLTYDEVANIYHIAKGYGPAELYEFLRKPA